MVEYYTAGNMNELQLFVNKHKPHMPKIQWKEESHKTYEQHGSIYMKFKNR